jgi:hypothetical protein
VGGEIKQKLAAILAADAVGFSRLMGMDERATLVELDTNRALFRRHCEEHEGRIVDMVGDSVLAVFASVAGAVRAAVAAQAAVEERGSCGRAKALRRPRGQEVSGQIQPDSEKAVAEKTRNLVASPRRFTGSNPVGRTPKQRSCRALDPADQREGGCAYV